MCKAKQQANLDMFDINGENKLDEGVVFLREDIVKDHAKNSKCVFFVSHSAGKDSSAQYARIKQVVPNATIVVVHATLGAVEHDGVIEHIEANIQHPLYVVKNPNKDFIDMVLLRGMFPSSQHRQCTSDLKQGPIYSFIRKYMKENGFTVGFNCTGLRSDESKMRAKKNPLFVNKSLTLESGARTVYDWMPVFHMPTSEVFTTILEDGQTLHKAYGKVVDGQSTGNQRLSCQFCIMGSKRDLCNAAAANDDHFAEMVALERVVGHTMFGKTHTVSVPEILAKGTKFDGGEVVGHVTYTAKAKLNAGTPYGVKVFTPIPLNEWIRMPVNELRVQFHVIRLRKRLAELKAIQREKTLAKKERKAKSANKKRDTDTIDFLTGVAG